MVPAGADAEEALCNLDARRLDDVDPVADAAAADALLPMMCVVKIYRAPLGQEFRGSGQSWNDDSERIVGGRSWRTSPNAARG